MTLLKVIVPECLEQDGEVEMFQSGGTEQFGLRGPIIRLTVSTHATCKN